MATLDTHYPVDILDHHGNIIGSKPRIELDKRTDIYHSINILLITPMGELVLQTIPENQVLPNICVGTFGVIATVRRSGETDDEAAARTMSRQLFIDDMPLTKLGGRMYDLADGRRSFLSSYYGIADPPSSFSLVDIESLVVMSPRQLDGLVNAGDALDKVAINLYTIWKEFRKVLPL